MNVQFDLGFCCLHMPKDMFSHGPAHLFFADHENEVKVTQIKLTLKLVPLKHPHKSDENPPRDTKKTRKCNTDADTNMSGTGNNTAY